MGRDGFPLGYEMFDGNRTDVTTVQQIVEAMEAKYGRAGRIWVTDRGMVSEENLAFLRSREARYLVGTPRAMLRQFEKHLLQKNWHEVSEGVEVKLCCVTRPDAAGRTLIERLGLGIPERLGRPNWVPAP